MAAYRRDKTGPVSSGLLELVGFPRIDERLDQYPAYRKAKAANMGRDPFGRGGQPHFELDSVGMFSTAFQWHYPVPKDGSYMSAIIDLLRPVSEGGQVTLNRSDPLVQPSINLNFFADDPDILAMREGFAGHTTFSPKVPASRVWWWGNIRGKCPFIRMKQWTSQSWSAARRDTVSNYSLSRCWSRY